MTSKRLFDLFFTIPGLILLTPAFIVIALSIKIDSRGPVFFRQQRVGMCGYIFRIFKFRTMITEAEQKGLQITTGDDVRITKVGKFLRKTKLDELPQLINVLKGEMSLVGPRPEVPKYVACYPDNVKAIVLSVPPGITDNASIEYKDEAALMSSAKNPEATYINEILPQKLKYYTQYAEHHSIAGDFAIILKTLKEIA